MIAESEILAGSILIVDDHLEMAKTLAERERCALVCESFGGNGPGYIDDDWARMCAAAIRDS